MFFNTHTIMGLISWVSWKITQLMFSVFSLWTGRFFVPFPRPNSILFFSVFYIFNSFYFCCSACIVLCNLFENKFYVWCKCLSSSECIFSLSLSLFGSLSLAAYRPRCVNKCSQSVNLKQLARTHSRTRSLLFACSTLLTAHHKVLGCLYPISMSIPENRLSSFFFRIQKFNGIEL